MPNLRLRLNSLSFKTGIYLILVGLLPLILYACFSINSAMTGLKQLEQEQNEQRLNQSRIVLEKFCDELLTTAKDYGSWDEMFQQAPNPDPQWLKINLTEWVPLNFGVDFILLVDKSGKVKYRYQELSTFKSQVANLPEIKQGLAGKTLTGLLVLPEGFYSVAVSPITPSDSTNKVNGALLFAKKITNRQLENISQLMGSSLALEYQGITIGKTTPKTYAEKNQLLKNRSHRFGLVTPKQGICDTVYTSISDLRGEKITLAVTSDSQAVGATINNLSKNIVPVMIIAVLLALLLSFFLSKYAILGPLQKLRNELLTIKTTGAIQYLSTSGPYEISDLARVFNEMAASLEDNIARTKILELQARIDSLTGLYGYCYLNERLNEFLSTSKTVTILFCDLDFFKNINDIYGHLEGDKILVYFAKLISNLVGEIGFTARFGGEEFVAVLPETEKRAGIEIAELIRKRAEESLVRCCTTDKVVITVSIGVATYPDDSENPNELIPNAEKALYYAKQMGRNQVQKYTQNMGNNLDSNFHQPYREEFIFNSVQALAAAVDLRDQYTGRHSVAVASLALLLAREIGLPESECHKIRMVGLLHDLGKIGIPDHILLKTKPLTPKEKEVIESHPILSANLLKLLNIVNGVEDLVIAHHERYDGNGYPRGLAGEEIPLGARIVGLVDAYHAMISDRPYRKARKKVDALAELTRNKGKQFDPQLVEVFIRIINRA